MFVKAKERKLYEDVVNQVRHLIETGQLKPGDLLPSEETLSREIGVSRATVREGLRILGLMGFVETRRGKGTVVLAEGAGLFGEKFTAIFEKNGKDSLHVLELDQILEPGMARIAAEKSGTEDIERLKGALDKMEEALAKGESGESESLYFHQCIATSLQNPLLVTIFELTREIHKRDRALLAAMPRRPEHTLKEHYRIYDAIRKRDGRLASRYMEEHLRKVAETYNEFFQLMELEK